MNILHYSLSNNHSLVTTGFKRLSTGTGPATATMTRPSPDTPRPCSEGVEGWRSLRCIDLTLVANALAPEIATLNYLNSFERLPASALAMLVGMVTIFATEFLDSTAKILMHPLISAALRIDLANPCKQAHIKWQPNSMCGCGADLAQYANGQVQVQVG